MGSGRVEADAVVGDFDDEGAGCVGGLLQPDVDTVGSGVFDAVVNRLPDEAEQLLLGLLGKR